MPAKKIMPAKKTVSRGFAHYNNPFLGQKVLVEGTAFSFTSDGLIGVKLLDARGGSEAYVPNTSLWPSARENPAKRAVLTPVTQWSSKQITAWLNSELGDNGHIHVAAQIIGKGRIALAVGVDAVGKEGVIADARGSTEKAALLALARKLGMLR